MTDVERWRLTVFLFSSLAGAAIASADRMNFPDDPKAYEPPTKGKTVPVIGPLAREATPDAHLPPIAAMPDRSTPLSKPSIENSLPDQIVERQTHALSPTPRKIVVAVGFISGILFIGFTIKRLAGREKSVPPEPVLIPGVGDASTLDAVGPPEYLSFFGLDATAHEEDVLRVYRERSWTVHPDHGGNAVAFKEMQRQFERSLAFVRRRRIR